MGSVGASHSLEGASSMNEEEESAMSKKKRLEVALAQTCRMPLSHSTDIRLILYS